MAGGDVSKNTQGVDRVGFTAKSIMALRMEETKTRKCGDLQTRRTDTLEAVKSKDRSSWDPDKDLWPFKLQNVEMLHF